jgi:uncharacterized protein YcsI (UPF0317 family)
MTASSDRARLSASEARRLFRTGGYRGPTSGFAAGFCQANLLVLPAAAADEFERYCRLNPAPCPLIERLAPGDPVPRRAAPAADLRVDLPRYRRFDRAGWRDCLDLTGDWPNDAVAFLLGCSFTAEEALVRAGVPLRHVEEGRNVSMYRTTRATLPAGPFAGPLVVSMRPVPAERVPEVFALTEPYRAAHGAPVHHGDPAVLGVGDLSRPEWGDPVSVRPGEVPVFWACGVTSQVAVVGALASGAIPWAISHVPGHMFITDLPSSAARIDSP